MKNPNLTPIVLQDPVKAKQLSLKNLLKDEEGQSLILLRSLTGSIKRLEDKACELIGEAQTLHKQKSRAEYQLMQLGVSIGRIEEATKELKDPEYVRTEEREKQDEERKRKIEEENKEKERELKHQKTIPVTTEGEEIIREKPQEQASAKVEVHPEPLLKQVKTELQILKEPEEDEEEERVKIDIDDEDLGFDDASQSLKQDILFWTPTRDLLQLQQPIQQAAQFQQLDQVEQSAQAEQSVPQFLQPENPPAVKCQSRLEQFLSPKVFRRLKGLQSQSIIPQGTSQMMLPQATAQPTSQLGLPQPTLQLGLPQTPSQMMLQGTAQGLASGVSQSMMQVFPQGV